MLTLNQVHVGCALELLEKIPANSIDLVLTDPPYGVNFVSRMPVEGFEKPPIANDSPAEALHLMRYAFREFHRVLKEGSVVLVFAQGGGPRSTLPDVWSLFRDNFTEENCIAWDKEQIGMGWRYRPSWEALLVGYKGKERKTWNGGSSRSNVLREQRIVPPAGEHPTPKPPDLITRLILDNSNEAEVVLDPFCGSGVVPLCCEREKRLWIACELEPKWAALAMEKVNAEKAQLKLF